MQFPWLRSKSTSIGQQAEQQSLNFLEQQGLTLVTRNYRCRAGEIDLIMRDNDALVFIEVRYRNNNNFGSGAETVTRSKQHKIIKTAQHFLCHQHVSKTPLCRFDVVAVFPSDCGQSSLQFDWIKHAFQC